MNRPMKLTVRPMISAVLKLLPDTDGGDFDAVGVVDDVVGRGRRSRY